jgi:Mn-dependent DtxR family transcriptional regulator
MLSKPVANVCELILRNTGIPHAGESQNEVARTLNVNQSTISRLWNRFQQTGSTDDRQSSGRYRMTTPGLDRYIRAFHAYIHVFCHYVSAAENEIRR